MADGQRLGVHGCEGLVSQSFHKAQGELDLVSPAGTQENRCRINVRGEAYASKLETHFHMPITDDRLLEKDAWEGGRFNVHF